jgi:pimeloyl-ACP methyl ester carboxylesterase
MIFYKDLILNTHLQRPLVYDLWIPDKHKAPLVVFCHGFKGFKNWGPWDLMAEYICQLGFAFVKFNFTHNGVCMDSLYEFNDPQGFGMNTTGLELGDLGTLVDYLLADTYPKYDSTGYSLIGHSRGGSVAILQAASDERVSKLITWNAVADLHSWIRKYDIDSWRSSGHVVIKNARTGQELPMDFSYYQDLVDHAEQRDVLAAAGKIQVPWTVIHAEDDEAVPVEQANLLVDTSTDAQLEIIEDAGHTFGGKHPWTSKSLPDTLKKAIDVSLA